MRKWLTKACEENLKTLVAYLPGLRARVPRHVRRPASASPGVTIEKLQSRPVLETSKRAIFRLARIAIGPRRQMDRALGDQRARPAEGLGAPPWPPAISAS